MTRAALSAFAPAHVLCAALRERQISAVELLEHYLSRIAHLNPAINAIVTMDEQAARRQAQAADAALHRGEFDVAL